MSLSASPHGDIEHSPHCNEYELILISRHSDLNNGYRVPKLEKQSASLHHSESSHLLRQSHLAGFLLLERTRAIDACVPLGRGCVRGRCIRIDCEVFSELVRDDSSCKGEDREFNEGPDGDYE